MKEILDLYKVRGIANYQFGGDTGNLLFPEGVKMKRSRKTGKIKYVLLNERLLATLRPKDGLFSLTIFGAEKLVSILKKPTARVVVMEDVKEFVIDGRNVFSKHVIMADEEVRVGEEVIVTDKDDCVLAVGKALLTGKEMLVFKRGIAVKVRRGLMEEKRCEE